MVVQIARRHFTVTEYDRMVEAGILGEDDRVELIEGEIIEMSPIGPRHAAHVKRLNTLVSQQVGDAAIVSVQDPIHLAEYSEPEPDIALLRPRADFYAQGHPAPPDVLLVVEVAETSLEYDRDVKVPLYAQALIPEVWLVDLANGTIHVYSQPANGAYQVISQATFGDALVSQALPGRTLDIDSILG